MKAGTVQALIAAATAAALMLWLSAVAMAAPTVVMPGQGEPSLATPGGILDGLYGLGNLTRMDDSIDQVWGNLGVAETIPRAKYAGYMQQVGYLTGTSGGVFVPVLEVVGSGLLHVGSATFTVAQSGERFRWADDPNGAGGAPGLWSSIAGENDGGGLDHMVTWMITAGAGHPGNHLGAFVVAFEDLEGLGDRDYNDFVREVRGVSDGPVPQPGGLALMTTALVGLGALAWCRGQRTDLTDRADRV